MKTMLGGITGLDVFEQLESEVRSYCRSFKTVFTRAKNARLWDVQGKEYIDFFAGAGALNYGHNNTDMKQKLIDYLVQDGITHSLDMSTQAKQTFLLQFRKIILEPRGLDYKVMFPGPTGTNSVESALKIARKVTGRHTVVGFTNGFHGMTLGSLSVTGNQFKRSGAGLPLSGSVMMPYDGFFGDEVDTADYLEQMVESPGSGVDLPAAVVVETLQGEGGLHAARAEWLKRIEAICRRNDILLIIDDVQMGCGRTGTFFSFEEAGIDPDVICLSKSIGGFGLPLALTLIKPEYDVWSPGEHNGTFRGNNLAFVSATEALNNYWRDEAFTEEIARKGELIRRRLEHLTDACPDETASVRGKGMIQGIAFKKSDGVAEQVCKEAFQSGLIMETSGPESDVVKVMPPLTIEKKLLEKGLDLLEESVQTVLANH